MKFVFPVCGGVDVHKTFMVATIITAPADSVQSYQQKKRFSTLCGIYRKVLDSCAIHPGKHDIRAVIANPKWAKAVKGSKNDTKDSKWVGDLLHRGLVKSSFIPDLDIRILREFTCYRYKLVPMKI